jgi:hypothetical protein
MPTLSICSDTKFAVRAFSGEECPELARLDRRMSEGEQFFDSNPS